MSESGDYNPGGWAGHDFADARASYGAHARTSLHEAVNKGVTRNDLVPEQIFTDSTNPVGIVIDESGSMYEWPATMRSKLPYLEHEAKTEYMCKDVEISWGAIGDANNIRTEKYPLQVRPFTKGTDLAKRLDELVIEGDGGGTQQETYELAALYYARNANIPNAIRPLLIFVGDESPYESVDPNKAKLVARVILEETLKTSKIFDELKRKFSVYFVQKPYGHEALTEPLAGVTKTVHENWAKLLGEDHIAMLDDPGRVVDVIFGIMAREAGKVDYFKKELKDRQNPSQVETVMTSLKTVHMLPGSQRLLGSGLSVTRRKKI